jgi:hypothetical protein
MTQVRTRSLRRPSAALGLVVLVAALVLGPAGVASAHRASAHHRGHARMHKFRHSSTRAASSFLNPAALPGGFVVCNEAQSSPRGTLDASGSADPLPPARHKDAAMPVGKGGGLINAADNSPALAVCTPALPGDGGGGTT